MRLLGDTNIPEISVTSLTLPKSADLAKARRSKLLIRVLIVLDLLVSTLFLYVSTVDRSKVEWLNDGLSSLGFLLGLAGILGALLYGMLQTLFHELAFLDREGLRHAIRTRDCRGRRIPSAQLRACLTEQKDLTEQPPAFLLATIASDKETDHDLRNRCINALMGEDVAAPKSIQNLPADTAATILTKVDFVCSDNPLWRTQALAAISSDLWLRATNDLLGASQSEARRAGMKSVLASQKRLRQLCRNDEDGQVRAEAWERVKASLSQRNVKCLLQSPHVDVRCAVLQSGIPGRNLLLRLAQGDQDLSVRQQAWREVQANLSSKECGDLCTSKFTDVRKAVTAHDKISPNLLLKLAYDSEEAVRVIALPRVLKNATPAQYYRLSRCSYEDVRMRLAHDPKIPPKILNRLKKDRSIEVRTEALVRLLPAEDLTVLSTDKDIAVRAAVAKHPLASKALLHLLSVDEDTFVRKVASQHLLEDVTEKDLEVLSTNKEAYARSAVAKHPLAPKTLLRILSGDVDSDARKAASQRLLEDATSEDLATLSTNKDADVRVTVARHQNTTKTMLVNFAADNSHQVREAALPRILPQLSSRQYETLCQSQHVDVLYAIATFPQTPRESLLTLACDKNISVRSQALPRILPDLSFPEIANLLKSSSQYSDVQNPVLDSVTKKLGQPGAEVVLPHLRDGSRQREVVKAVLDLEGDSAVAKIQRTVGSNETIRLASSSRIIAFCHSQSPSRVADFLADIGKSTLSYRIGTTTEEREETNYDPYSSSSTSYYTHTENTLISVSHYEKSLVEIVIECLEAMDASKRAAVVGLLDHQNSELARLVSAGLEKREWHAAIHAEVLERAHAYNESNFTLLCDDDIIKQIR